MNSESEYNHSQSSFSHEDEEVKRKRPIIQNNNHSLSFQLHGSSEGHNNHSISSVGNLSIPEETKYEVDQF